MVCDNENEAGNFRAKRHLSSDFFLKCILGLPAA